MCGGEQSVKTSFLLFDIFLCVKQHTIICFMKKDRIIFLCVVYTHTRSKTIKYSCRCSDVLLLSGSLKYVSIQ